MPLAAERATHRTAGDNGAMPAEWLSHLPRMFQLMEKPRYVDTSPIMAVSDEARHARHRPHPQGHPPEELSPD
jgi:hypothetical protein